MERKGLISVDAMISMILIISLIYWMQLLVDAQTDDVNVYGARLQTDHTIIAYGSMVNNYYAANPTTKLVLAQPAIKEMAYHLKRTPQITKQDNRLIIHAFEIFSYPVPYELDAKQIDIRPYGEKVSGRTFEQGYTTESKAPPSAPQEDELRPPEVTTDEEPEDLFDEADEEGDDQWAPQNGEDESE